ncbi:MAG: dihydrolipoyl dehydrogenase [Simkaniaceae bacterium]|nr:dihydrolipoyl dehydrogenase [Simkaniaceae bacterium]
MKHYDQIVIGTGGGTKLVSPVAAMGKKVAVIERERLGGTCLNRGCIPSKMLIHVSDLAENLREANRFELKVNPEFEIDFSALIDRVQKTIKKDSDSIQPAYDRNPNIDLYHGEAHFVGKKIIEVNGEQISADRILIATGAEASVPHIEGLEGTPYMTYRTALTSEKLPKSCIVLGGGFIAVELGYFYGALGCDVTFLVRSKLLRPEDDDISEEFTRVFSERFPVVCGVVPNKVEYDGTQFHVHTDDKTYTAEALLVATGIAPETKPLNLEKTGVKVDERGFIQVDNRLRTSCEGIWALGDCVGNYFFRHSANYEGEYLFRTLYQEPSDEPIEYYYMPHAVFTRPQIGSVGPAERELKKAGVEYVVGKVAYKNSAMGMALMAEHGFVKLLFDKNSGALLAAHIIGEEASDMVHMLIAYIHMGGTIMDMLATVYIHPALPELVRNAARDAYKNWHKDAS